MMSDMQDVFQAMVPENTVEDEPDAPPIADVKNLISRSCKGVCDPRSKTCVCLMNQRKIAANPYLEFVYNRAGQLKIPGCPVFECTCVGAETSVAIGLVGTNFICFLYVTMDSLIFWLESCTTWLESSSFHPEDGA
jgi:hypothetical protein